MNMISLLRNIFHYEIPPDPAPPPQTSMDDADIRWARSKIAAITRRAHELDVESELQKRYSNDSHS